MIELAGGLVVLSAALTGMTFQALRGKGRAEAELMNQRAVNVKLRVERDAAEKFARLTAETNEQLVLERKAEREKFEQREADFLRQIQSQAERIASLRMKGLNEGGNDTFIPTKPDKPYSEDLERFLDGMLTEEARNMVEERIEQLRARGIEDEQIYTIIREGE